MSAFADRLAFGIDRLHAPCVVGLDPRVGSLPRFAWEAPSVHGLDPDSAAVVAWGSTVIEAVAGLVPMVKLQSACYECLGENGYRALDRTVELARDADLLVLLDAKRGDIGSTASAYAETAFSARRLDVDAMTVNHYFGADGLEPFMSHVHEGKGLFVVVHSSNPSAVITQDVRLERESCYYELVGDLVAEWGSGYMGECGYSSVGAVVGATFPQQLRALRDRHPAVPFLIPGYGQQGGSPEDVVGGFGTKLDGAVVSASRAIYGLGPQQEMIGRPEFVDIVAGRTSEMVREIVAAVSSDASSD